MDCAIRIVQDVWEDGPFAANHDRRINKVLEIALQLEKKGIKFQSSIGIWTGKEQKVMNRFPTKIEYSKRILPGFLLEFAIRCTIASLNGVPGLAEHNRTLSVVDPDLRHCLGNLILNQVTYNCCRLQEVWLDR